MTHNSITRVAVINFLSCTYVNSAQLYVQDHENIDAYSESFKLLVPRGMPNYWVVRRNRFDPTYVCMRWQMG